MSEICDVLITAGPTYEPIDPVRFIGNRSSGKMGYAIAEAFANLGFRVQLVSGPVALEVQHQNIQLTKVETAHEMFDACSAHVLNYKIAVMAAAVADYSVRNPNKNKIKKDAESNLTLELVPNKDILAWFGQQKRADQLLVGFSLETDNEIENAKSKLIRKGADFLIMNSLRDSGVGFGADTNKISLISECAIEEWPLMLKKDLAAKIANICSNEYQNKKSHN